MSDFEDDLPPLDDMSEQIAQMHENKDLILLERDARKQRELQETQRKELQETLAKAEKANPNINASLKSTASKTTSTAPAKDAKPPVADDDFLPGFKKGFLFKKRAAPASSSKSQTSTPTEKSSKSTSTEEPIVVQPIKGSKEAAQKSLQFPEVAAAMSASASPNWVTSSLLETVTKDDILSKGMQNPRILQALGELQQNPTAAFAKYSKDKEVTEFLQQWIATMASHAQPQPPQQQQQQPSGAPTKPTTQPTKAPLSQQASQAVTKTHKPSPTPTTTTTTTTAAPATATTTSSSATSSSSSSLSSSTSGSTARPHRLLDDDIGTGVASLLLNDKKNTHDDTNSRDKSISQPPKPQGTGILIEEIDDDDDVISIGFGKTGSSGKSNNSGISLIEEVDEEQPGKSQSTGKDGVMGASTMRKGMLIEEVDDEISTVIKPVSSIAATTSTIKPSPVSTVSPTVPKPAISKTNTANKAPVAAVSSAGGSANAGVDMVDFNGRRVPRKQLEMWMAHPLIRSVLADPMTNSMLSALRNDVNIFPKIITDQRIQVLVRAGILEVPPQFISMFKK